MRKFLFFVILIFAIALYLFKVDEKIVKNFNSFNELKVFYIDKIVNFTTTLENYFEQITTIKSLKNENKELKEYKILYQSTKEQLKAIKELMLNTNPEVLKPKIELVKVISYVSFKDFTKVWLNQEKNDDTILGLISDSYAAGIAINKDGKLVGLLNGNKECSYAVFIGEEKAPGIITSGEKANTLEIKFIPVWTKIEVGDEVVTSGMDSIFFEGLKVGKVTQISNLPEMKIAKIEPYAKVLEKKYFYTYKNIEENTQKIKEEESTSNK